MTEYKFEDLSTQTVAQLRKIAEGVEHETLQDPTKMPKGELLAALCQALGIEAGESPEKTVLDKEPAAQEDIASETASESSEDEEPAAQESKAAEASEEKVENQEPAAVQEDAAIEPPEESAKEEPATVQEDAASEPPEESTQEKKASAQESTPTESPAVVNREKSKLKVQIRELKSQRNAALVAHDHVQLKSIRRRIRTLKRKVRRLAA